MSRINCKISLIGSVSDFLSILPSSTLFFHDMKKKVYWRGEFRRFSLTILAIILLAMIEKYLSLHCLSHRHANSLRLFYEFESIVIRAYDTNFFLCC